MRIPLDDDNPDVALDLHALFDRCYDAGGYARRLDYQYEPDTSLLDDDMSWADALVGLHYQTNHIERFNNTLRQGVSRLVREALSFSKKLANHVRAITLFIRYDNLTRAAV